MVWQGRRSCIKVFWNCAVEHSSTPKMPWVHTKVFWQGLLVVNVFLLQNIQIFCLFWTFFWWQSIVMIYPPASQMKGRRARQIFVVKFSMNETQMTMHLDRYNRCKIMPDNLSNDKVNRCLARYSLRATTTSQPINRAPNEPAMVRNAKFGPNLVVSGQKILFLLEKSKVLLLT